MHVTFIWKKHSKSKFYDLLDLFQPRFALRACKLFENNKMHGNYSKQQTFMTRLITFFTHIVFEPQVLEKLYAQNENVLTH